MSKSAWDILGENALPEGAVGWDMMGRPVQAGMRPIPKSPKRLAYEIALKKVPWESVRDNVAVPIMNEASKGTEAAKDSVNSYIQRSVSPSEKLINDALGNYFRKFGK